jgi:DNA adenine methylase
MQIGPELTSLPSVDQSAPLPLLKWVGGKRQLLPHLHKMISPIKYKHYFEPFVGGGALIFSLCPHNSPIINDLNEELINVYRVVKNHPKELLESLSHHLNTEEYFYTIRNIDRTDGWQKELGEIERASRVIYLNKTCFNGLFRMNKRGHFNTPYGRYANPTYSDHNKIYAVSRFLNNSDVGILCGDFSDAVCKASAGDLVYFDPPYDPLSETSSFTSYAKEDFLRKDQERLKKQCDILTAKGVYVVLSNSATEFIKTLYSDYNITVVGATRMINSNAEARGKVNEVIVNNFNLL